MAFTPAAADSASEIAAAAAANAAANASADLSDLMAVPTAAHEQLHPGPEVLAGPHRPVAADPLESAYPLPARRAGWTLALSSWPSTVVREEYRPLSGQSA